MDILLRLPRLRGQEAPLAGQVEKQTLSPRNALQHIFSIISRKRNRWSSRQGYYPKCPSSPVSGDFRHVQHVMAQLASANDDLEKESRSTDFRLISESKSLVDRSFSPDAIDTHNEVKCESTNRWKSLVLFLFRRIVYVRVWYSVRQQGMR